MVRSIVEAGWRFDNSYARLPEPLFAPASPTPVRAPRLLLVNESLAVDLGLDPGILREEGAAVCAGNEMPPGAAPIAQAYAGHQFGQFTNLGDGRAILLGEQVAGPGRFDIQLKGAGRTRYSRGGDGRAALGPMLREYVISEAMHALGVPTTRSLAVAVTGEVVMRTTPLPGAVLARVATSHIRVGTFELAAALGRRDVLAALLEHAIARHDPDLAERPPGDRPLAFLERVVERQAALVARWMLVGFVHGVMNTDNMAVSGETIDYGPCAFLDTYDPATVFSSIDVHGRYAYANQPGIAHWNLARLAESLLPLVPGDDQAVVERARSVLDTFPGRFAHHHLDGGRAKLGLVTEEDADAALLADLFAAMHADRADFTATFASLAGLAESAVRAGLDGSSALGEDGSSPENAVARWRRGWLKRLARQTGGLVAAAACMGRANPLAIARNHRVEEALAAAEGGDLGPLNRFLGVLRQPFTSLAGGEAYQLGPPPGCGSYRTFCGT